MVNDYPDKKSRIAKSVRMQSNFSESILRNYEETISFGSKLIKTYPEIKILFLEGPLGAGKTSLVKGIGKGLGIIEPITSPTFALAHHYSSLNKTLFHLDLYRLENQQSANLLFLQEDEQARDAGALIVVEWPERMNLYVKEAWKIKLTFRENEERKLQIFSP